MSEQRGDPAIQRVELFVTGFGNLRGEFSDDDVFRQILVVDQLEALEIGDFERSRLAGRLWVVLVLAMLRCGGKFTAKRLDEMGPVLFDIGAQVEIARLLQAFAR